MTINRRDIIMLTIGSVTGSIITYFAVKGHINSKYEDISANEIEEAKKTYDYKLSELQKQVDVLLDPPVVSEEEMRNIIAESKERVRKKMGDDDPNNIGEDDPMDGFTDYTKYYTGKAAESDSFDIDQEVHKLKPIFKKPYIITEEDLFAVDGDSIVSVDYFVKDHKLVDGPDVIDEKDEVVGLNNIKKLVEGDEEVIYVMNPTSELVYEICRVDDYYDEEDNGNEPDYSL